MGWKKSGRVLRPLLFIEWLWEGGWEGGRERGREGGREEKGGREKLRKGANCTNRGEWGRRQRSPKVANGGPPTISNRRGSTS